VNFKTIIRENLKQLLFVFLAFALMVLVSYFFVAEIAENQVSVNAGEVFRTAYRMAITLSLLGLVFMIILSFFLIRLSMEKTRSDEENKSKSSFLARMSHEIRTPMNSILGMAELITRKNVSPEIDEYISIISQSGHTLLAIINDILDFSKISSGQIEIENRPYRLASLINDTINVIRMRILEKSLDFVVAVDGAIPAQLIGDDVRLRQILINLLNNAIKYTPKGYVSLNIQHRILEDHRLELSLSVRDTGVGIKPEDMRRLFSDFTRLDMKNNQGIEGTGLGLAITHTLCTAMGGRIVVTSEYGKGSVFTAVVIQSIGDDTKLAQVRAPETNRNVFQRNVFQRNLFRRIVVFEDRPLFLESLKSAFANLGLDPVYPGTLGEFTAELEKGTCEYAFVSSRYALDCMHALGKSNSPVQLVIMVEMGDLSIFREVKSIMMPVYSLSIANVLNNTDEAEYAPSGETGFNFTAPSARVLIVDDISSNLRVAKELMAPYKMEVHTCLSGAEAVRLVKTGQYDLVFMDHMMPEMDGLEAAAAIRGWEAELGKAAGEPAKPVPLIALTANAIVGQREMFLQQGLDDFLAKPIEVKQLNTLLERWIPEAKKIKTAKAGEDAPPEETAVPPVDGPDAALLRLEALKNALLTLDIETVNRILMEHLSMPMDGSTKERLGKIEDHILMFEYDEAVEEINLML
jgi:signal transduction histidine kinase/CheY-like chemotaxis protein